MKFAQSVLTSFVLLGVAASTVADDHSGDPMLVVKLGPNISTAMMTRYRNTSIFGRDLLNSRLQDGFTFSLTGAQTVSTVTLPPSQIISIPKFSPIKDGDTLTVTITEGTTSKNVVPDANNNYQFQVPASGTLTLDVLETAAADSTPAPAAGAAVAAAAPGAAAATPGPAKTPATVAEFRLTIGAATSADFTSQVGALAVRELGPKSPTQFGIRAPTYTVSSKLTLDTISTFSGGSSATASTSLGGGLTYSTLIGSSSEPSAKTVFGFPAMITFTVGFQGVTFGNNVNGNGSHPLFFAIGISIPTGKPKTTAATPSTSK
jgi:hypothetical protein